MINAKQTIGEIAASQPSTIEVFEQMGIQYCCHGEETLDETCRYLGLPVKGIMNELNSAIETSAMKIAPWTDSVLEAMMGHLIRTRKSLIHENLPRIEHLANSVGSCDCHDQPNAAEVAGLAGTLVREIPSHLSEESESLFPAIRDLELAYVGEGFRTPTPDSVRRSVAQMVHEHDVFGQHLSMIQTLTVGNAVTEMDWDPYRQLCEKLTDLDRELRLEVHLENNILFNRALRISKALYG